jgi:pimeloyl-ACP methyl ester carboxylesterase
VPTRHQVHFAVKGTVTFVLTVLPNIVVPLWRRLTRAQARSIADAAFPTTLLVGRHDPVAPVKWLQLAAARLRGTLVVTGALGHPQGACFIYSLMRVRGPAGGHGTLQQSPGGGRWLQRACRGLSSWPVSRQQTQLLADFTADGAALLLAGHLGC